MGHTFVKILIAEYAIIAIAYACQHCGTKSIDSSHLNIHHKDKDNTNICVACHNSGAPWAKHKHSRNGQGRWV